MGKKAKEFNSGAFIFAKVKGYPAWPARVQGYNGKKYTVYFYGTGETANLPPNMIFDYAENKAKFLTKAQKRRDFVEGAKQIELDFVNNTPLDQIIGPVVQAPADDTANDSAISMDVTAADADTTANDTVGDTTATTQNETAVEDSDDPGALVIDEKQKPRKSAAKTPAKEPIKTPKTPRSKSKKEDAAKEEEEGKKEDEIISRSGRKIRPKRYVDEQTEDNATLPSPAIKKRRASAEKETAQKSDKDKTAKSDFNNVSLSELEDLKEPFKSADPEKDSILMAYLPTGNYVGIKLFDSYPDSFKNDAAKLQWDKQAAANAITLKRQLERGQISPRSILSQLVMDLNLTDEEKAALDKERETEEKKSRVNFLKAEMKLIELDAKIKSCLCLEKADTDLCLKLLDELAELDVRPLMLLKHPTCLETVKRMRAYVGNTPSWDLSETDALHFGKQAHLIRKQADALYAHLKTLFTASPGLSFWEYFSERALQFKRATASLTADELLEMVHEPLEMTKPTSHTMRAAVEAANVEEPMDKEERAEAAVAVRDPREKEKATPRKRDRSNRKETPKKDKAQKKDATPKKATKEAENQDREAKKAAEANEVVASDQNGDGAPMEVVETEKEDAGKEDAEKKDAAAKKKGAAKSKKTPSKPVIKRQSSRKQANNEDQEQKADEPPPEPAKESTEPEAEATEPKEPSPEEPKAAEPEAEKVVANGDDKGANDAGDLDKTAEEVEDKTAEEEKPDEKKNKEDEPRAKRSRQETKKTEAPPRSPARTRKAKA